jgi:hypothetical protein
MAVTEFFGLIPILVIIALIIENFDTEKRIKRRIKRKTEHVKRQISRLKKKLYYIKLKRDSMLPRGNY